MFELLTMLYGEHLQQTSHKLLYPRRLPAPPICKTDSNTTLNGDCNSGHSNSNTSSDNSNTSRGNSNTSSGNSNTSRGNCNTYNGVIGASKTAKGVNQPTSNPFNHLSKAERANAATIRTALSKSLLSLPATPTFTRRAPRLEKKERKNMVRPTATNCSCRKHHENKDLDGKQELSRDNNQLKGKAPKQRRRTQREKVVLDSVKINVPLCQAALNSDEDIDINSFQIPAHEQQFLASDTIQSNGHVARLTKPNREHTGLDNGDTTLFQPKGRKTLPTLPSEQLLQEIAAVKEELRRRHLSEVS